MIEKFGSKRERYTAYALAEYGTFAAGEGYQPDTEKYTPYHADTPEQAAKLAADASISGEPYTLTYEYYSTVEHRWLVGEYLDTELYYVDA